MSTIALQIAKHETALRRTKTAKGDHMGDMEQFGDLIRRARERKGWSQRDFATELGRDPNFVWRLELARNANPPDTQTFDDLACALDISKRSMLEALGYLDPDESGEVITDEEARLLDAVRSIPERTQSDLALVMRQVELYAQMKREQIALLKSG